MKRTYLVAFEKGNDSWSAFAPDVEGTGGLRETLEEARQSLREGIGYILADAIERGLALPEAKTSNVDFSGFDPNPAQSHYEIEWLTVDLAELGSHSNDLAKHAA